MKRKAPTDSYNTIIERENKRENRKLLYSMMFGLVVLAAVVIIPSFLLKNQQDMRQRASGDGYFRGINLMGPFQSPWGGTNVFATSQQLDYYNSRGLTTIRQPLLWEALQPAKLGPLDTNYLSMMDVFVNNVKARGMRVHFVPINQGVYPATSNNVIDGNDLADLWKKLATHYKNEPTVWAHDVMNEPYKDGNWNLSHGQMAIDAIRSVDSSKPIIISPQVEWPEGYNNFKGFSDPSSNLIYEAHVYFDKDKSGQYTAGGYDAEGAYPNIGIDLAKPFVDWCVAHNANCYMGEYGIPGGWTSGTPTTTYGSATNDPRWNTVLDNLLTYLDQNNISGTYWEGGPYGDVNSVEPNNLGQERPQMAILTKHLGKTLSSTPTPTVSVPITNTPATTTGDTISPIISITAPVAGAIVKPRTNQVISATATDNVGILRVEFLINGTITCTVSQAPYSCTWKVPGAKNKTYSIQAKSYDQAGNNSKAEINVTAK